MYNVAHVEDQFKEFDGLEEISLDDAEKVAGGPLLAIALAYGGFALASLAGFGVAVAQDQATQANGRRRRR